MRCVAAVGAVVTLLSPTLAAERYAVLLTPAPEGRRAAAQTDVRQILEQRGVTIRLDTTAAERCLRDGASDSTGRVPTPSMSHTSGVPAITARIGGLRRR
jgi:hypothetical protein